MADIGALRELHAFMVEHRVLYARVGELELRLESLPPARVDGDPHADPIDDERASLETLLHSTGVDPGPLLALSKRLRAA